MKVRKAIIPAAGPRKILATPALFFIRCGGQYRD